MLAALLGDGAELEPLKRLIIEKTEGNPFFMEEMVQALFEEGALVRNGAVKLTKPLSELKIPPTVQGILASRIDRLPADEKDLLQTLAVIGKEFPLGLIRQVAGKPDDELERMLADFAARRVHLRAAGPFRGRVHLQARADAGSRLQLVLERRKSARTRCARSRSAISRDRGDSTGTDRASLHGGGAGRTGNSILAAGRRASTSTLGKPGSHRPP